MTGMSNNSTRLLLLTLGLILLTASCYQAQASNLDNLGLNQVNVAWEKQTPSTAPKGRTNGNFVYDTTRNISLLFGGFDDDIDNNVWTYDGSAGKWNELQTTNQQSIFRVSTAAYDSTNDKIITFGGSDFGNYHDQTWSFDYTSKTWTQMSPDTSPSQRWQASMVFDEKHDRVILFGGNYLTNVLGDTWSYDYTSDNWTQLSPQTSPSARGGHSMVYDSIHEKVLLFGGWGDTSVNAPIMNDTWEFDVDTNEWTLLDDDVTGLSRGSAGMVYDNVNQGLILFGGTHDGYLADTWFFNSSTNHWTQLSTTDKPSSRATRNGLVYDVSAEKVVLFGGYDGDTYYNDTWEFMMENVLPTNSMGSTTTGNTESTTSTPPNDSGSKDSPLSITYLLLGLIAVPVTRKLQLRSKKHKH